MLYVVSFNDWLLICLSGFTKWLNFVLTPPDAADSGTQAEYDKGQESTPPLLLKRINGHMEN